MSYGLDEAVIEKMQSVFASYPQIQKVVLYGSRAKGNYRESSDIDLTLIGENIDFSSMQSIELELDDLNLPQTIDLSVYSDLSNQSLLEHIDRAGRVFYSRDET